MPEVVLIFATTVWRYFNVDVICLKFWSHPDLHPRNVFAKFEKGLLSEFLLSSHHLNASSCQAKPIISLFRISWFFLTTWFCLTNWRQKHTIVEETGAATISWCNRQHRLKKIVDTDFVLSTCQKQNLNWNFYTLFYLIWFKALFRLLDFKTHYCHQRAL